MKMVYTTEHSAVIIILLFISEIRCDGECGVQNFQDKILGGDVTAIDEYPWTALIRYKERNTNKQNWGCGGVLVGKKTVITAAHCVEDMALSALGDIDYVRLGEYDHTTDVDCVMLNGYEDCADRPIDYKVANVLIHPERGPKSKLHDIAILILEKTPPYTDFIRPICLPEQTLMVPDLNDKKGVLYVTGWGWTIGSFQSPSNVKRHVIVNYVNTSDCRNFYHNIDEKLQLCAGGEKGHNVCKGDSGGPLMFSKDNKWTLTGIVSYGPLPCGRFGFDGGPAVFTQISGYLPWIKSVLLSLIDQDKVLWEK